MCIIQETLPLLKNKGTNGHTHKILPISSGASQSSGAQGPWDQNSCSNIADKCLIIFYSNTFKWFLCASQQQWWENANASLRSPLTRIPEICHIKYTSQVKLIIPQDKTERMRQVAWIDFVTEQHYNGETLKHLNFK